MFDWFTQLSPLGQGLLGGTFTWLMTLAGAGIVFLKKELPGWLLDSMAGFAGGVMIAASFWSLLSPGIAIAEAQGGLPAWFVAAGGFLLGAGFIRIADLVIPHFHSGLAKEEGPKSPLHRSTLLFLAMLIHNIPEGLALGVAYGAVASSADFALGASLSGAIALTLGIGIQNFPEGIAVAMPLRKAKLSRWKCFHAGHGSALVEPISALIGAWLVLNISGILPWALAFAAGAMIFVVVEDLIPESQAGGRIDLATSSTLVGFTTMMILDVALG